MLSQLNQLAKQVVNDYNTIRHHSALGGKRQRYLRKSG